MIRFQHSEHVKPLPVVQIISLIDVLFVNLAFFMALSLHFNFESVLDISVPSARTVSEPGYVAEEIVVNVQRDGAVYLNQKHLSLPGLGALLAKAANVNPGQAVIVRADQKTFHGHVVRVLDECAKARIWNISFATTQA